MEEEINQIKQSINELATKYGIRYIVFKTTDTAIADGTVIGVNVEAEMIY